MSENLDKSAWGWAKKGEVWRRLGSYWDAVECFDKAFEQARLEQSPDEQLQSYLFARRGAAKTALGFTLNQDDGGPPGAIEDLERARALEPNNGWTLAQLGEAHRVYARDRYRYLDDAEFDKHIARALASFDAALPLLRENEAWLLAHKAITHLHRVLRVMRLDEQPLDVDSQNPRVRDDLRAAEEALARSLELHPTYAWAKGVYSMLCVIQRRYKEAMSLMGEGAVDDPQRNMQMHRAYGLLCRYMAGRAEDEEAREALYRQSVHCSQKVLDQYADDYMTIYTRAASIAALGSEQAQPICRAAVDELVNIMIRILASILILESQAGDRASALGSRLREAATKLYTDLEVAAIASHDPAWTQQAAQRRQQCQALLASLGNACDASMTTC